MKISIPMKSLSGLSRLLVVLAFAVFSSAELFAQEVIPPALVASPQFKPELKREVRGPFALSTLSQGTEIPVFVTPPCLEGNYYLAAQLNYDLGDANTETPWTTDLTIEFLNNTTVVWTKTLSVRMTDQTFVSTVFHQSLISCDPNYKIRIKTKVADATVPQNNISLQLLLFRDFDATFNPTAAIEMGEVECGPCINERSTVSWTYSNSGDYRATVGYDLEWVHIDAYEDFDEALVSTDPAAPFKFKEPVRITTALSNYTHSTYYPNGKLWYRVRAVGYNQQFPDHRINGQWFYMAGLPVSNHEPNITWSKQTVFAEEGKYKKIISYYDGLSYQRQVQTHLSTSGDTTVVGERLYDFEGRKAVDMMAVPAASTSLKYKPSFNNFTSTNSVVNDHVSDVQKKFYYDNGILPNGTITSVDGAGKYYSPANNTLKGFRLGYVPDAEGYVYSQTEYTNDNSGKIKKEAGVGKEFAIDNAPAQNHTNRHFYGTANSSELTRLFGSNAGKASHYKKNMDLDANGQVSISYLDQEGRVIATALAGSAPNGMSELASKQALPNVDVVNDIAMRGVVQGASIVTTQKILVPVPDVYHFAYSFTALGSDLQDMGLGCVDCLFDVRISMTDPDGRPVNLNLPVAIPGNDEPGTTDYIKHDVSIVGCTRQTGVDILFDVNLADVGDFTITKIITAKELTFEQVRSIISQKESIQTKITEIENTITVDPAECEICNSCEGTEELIDQALEDVTEQDCQNLYNSIVLELRMAHLSDPNYVAEDHVKEHENYCEYELCQMMKESEVFEKQMSRVENWSAGVTTYSPLASASAETNDSYPDPFFRPEGGGGYYIDNLRQALDNINIGTLNGTPVVRTISQATNPDEATMFIDANGNFTNSTSSGYHIFYYDLMERRSSMTPAAYAAELDEQRWAMFKHFYQATKRKILLSITELPEGVTPFKDCPKVKARLEMPEGLPTTPEEIEDYGEQQDYNVTGPISDAEVEAISSWITFSCKNDVDITPEHMTQLNNELKAYFDGKPYSVFKFILPADVGTNQHLINIQNILNQYECASLTKYALEDPSASVCVDEIIVTYDPNDYPPAQEIQAPMTMSMLASEPTIVPMADMPESQPSQSNIAAEPTTTSINPKTARSGSGVITQMSDPGERAALIALYNATGGPTTWKNRLNWNTAVDIGDWFGVDTDTQGRVISISLSNNGLTGQIPPEIGNFPYLRVLNLGTNTFTGKSIPAEIGQLTSLVTLDLRSSGFVGDIPAAIGQLANLETLTLKTNQLTGFMSFTGMTALKGIDVSFNSIDDPFPQDIVNCTQLTDVTMTTNQITGSLPPNINLLANLKTLSLGNNKIGGSIPPAFTQLANLEFVALDANQLTGGLPTNIGDLKKVYWFVIQGNPSLGGTIPSSIGGMTALKTFYANGCAITGPIPAEIGNCANLELLYLYSNLLTGPMPSTLGQLTKLNTFWASGSLPGLPVTNQLTGSLDWAIGLPKLYSLRVDGNPLNIPFPQGIVNCPELVQLYVSNCQMTGTLPTDIGKLTKLRYFYATNNQLAGPIPTDITKCTALEYLFLDNNKFTGAIPTNIGDLVNLSRFYIQSNPLMSGPIPTSIGKLDKMIHFYATNAGLTGSIPTEVGDCAMLQQFYVHNNYLSGTIPTSVLSSSTITTMSIVNNLYTFTDLTPVRQIRPTLPYSPMKNIDAIKTHKVVVGKDLTLSTTIDVGLSGCLYQWFKKRAVGGDLALNATPVADKHTIVIPNVTQAQDGEVYYYKITNPTASPTLTLTSNLQTLVVLPDGTKVVTVCKEFDPNNPALEKFTVNVTEQMWQEVVQKCIAAAQEERQILVDVAIEKLIEEEASTYFETSRTRCLESIIEGFTYAGKPQEYHYMLYYYDQAGNLVETVPPAGVDISGAACHKMITKYKYNSLNQVVWQKTPDAGGSNFWYDTKGRLRLSQNAQQFKDNKYSYLKYDNLGRIIEAGELNVSDVANAPDPKLGLENPLSPVASQYYSLTDVTKTYFDIAKETLQPTFQQDYLRNRVSYVEVHEKGASDVIATYYSYDIHGNVKSLLQQVPGLDYKRIDYNYDLVSGNLNSVFYEFSKSDQFIHRYTYDADNRLKDVYTSTDGFIWDHDANYKYYLHGPLARTELGHYRVQGLDHYYTLQGWIKGVNMPYAGDPANDGVGGQNLRVGKDVFSYALGYFEGDYKPSNNSKITTDVRDQLWPRLENVMGAGHNGLYNGNISWMVTDLAKIGEIKGDRLKGMQAMVYKYDQLNRILQARSLTDYAVGGFGPKSNTAYDEDFTYDPNGNILTLKRKNDASTLVDDFTYNYYAQTNKLRFHLPITDNKEYNGEVTSDNKLYYNINIKKNSYVAAGKDVVLKAINSIDFEEDNNLPTVFETRDNSTFHAYILGEDEGAYNYDAIGNLVWDHYRGIRISWNPAGKVSSVVNSDGTLITYRYDAAGNRIEKKTIEGGQTLITNYIRDGGGNVLAVYNNNLVDERLIFGSSRVGTLRGSQAIGERKSGDKYLELANHLGNVLSVVDDKIRMGFTSAWANVVAVNDYYVFGLNMMSRSSGGNYRFGLNGMEVSPELGDHYTAEFWEYDPRTGRRWNEDPVIMPYQSPYATFENNPVVYNDPKGDCPKCKDGDETYSQGQIVENEDGKWEYQGNHKWKTLHLNLGNSSKEFQKWFQGKGGEAAVDEMGDLIYNKKLGAYDNNFAKALYGAIDGAVSVPKPIKRRLRNEANEEAFSTLKALYASEVSGMDPSSLNYMFNPLARSAYMSARAEAVTERGEALGLISEVAFDVAFSWTGRLSALKMRSNALSRASKQSLKYAPRVRARGVEDPVGHNFPYSFDETILMSKPVIENSGYKWYRWPGSINSTEGVFEIGVTKDGIIDHRFFRKFK